MTGVSNSVKEPERLSFLWSLQVQEYIVLMKSKESTCCISFINLFEFLLIIVTQNFCACFSGYFQYTLYY